MKQVRRLLLELWAIVVLAGIVGFLGPFGTFLMGDFLSRLYTWWSMLMGAYVLTRPVILFCRWIARSTHLPPGLLVFSGIIASSFPMAVIWRMSAPDAMANLSGYSGLVPFSLLCALAVMVVAWWAERADAHLSYYYSFYGGQGLPGLEAPPAYTPVQTEAPGLAHQATAAPSSASGRPPLYARLGSGFQGDILALESEDHYVRVHGVRQSELLLMRLRDAIAAMAGVPGEQTHRSWWVAREAVAGTVASGRKREIRLVNGLNVPVARDLVDRLERSGFLKA